MASDTNESQAEVQERAVFTRRAALLGLGQAAVFAGLGGRLHQLQVLDASKYAPLADENRFNTLPLAPARGRIFDRFGVPLAGNAEGFRVTAVPALTGNLSHALDRLAQIVAIPPPERARVLALAKRQPVNLPIIVAGDLTWDQVASINLHAPDLPGIETETFDRRLTFHTQLFGHVVGHVGAVERFGMGDDPMLRIPGMRIGRTGVERGMEQRLSGAGGTVRREVDSRGRIVRNLERTEAKPGSDVVVTIDLELQRQVMQRVTKERRAAVVALDIATGDVVAMASSPAYDPALNVLPRQRGIITPGRLLYERERRANDPLVNRATNGMYPPGSTFKMVTALAALEAGLIDPRERVNCEGTYVLADRSYRCWNRGGHGRCDLHRAIRESCDVYFYEIARRLGIDAIAAMGVKLGLGQTYAAGISPQSKGLMPTAGWKRGRLGKPWLGGETLHAGIGQGYVLTTPLQLAVMTARIASGTMVQPRLVRPLDGQPPEAFARLAIADRWLQAVRRGLKAVVNEGGGTGARASLSDINIEVAGKTGTSQISRRSTDRASDSLRWEDRDHALFVGYFPAEVPRYAVSAVVEHGGGGGTIAAPLVRDVMQAILAHDPMRQPAFTPKPIATHARQPGDAHGGKAG